MQQDAWLDATPEGWKHNRATNLWSRGGDDELARWTIDPGPAQWLLTLLEDAGQVRVAHTMSGTRFEGLTWSDVKAWSELAGERIAPWTARALVLLSGSYAQALNRAREKDCPAPFDPNAAS